MAQHIGQRASIHAHLTVESHHAAKRLAIAIHFMLNQIQGAVCACNDIRHRRKWGQGVGQDCWARARTPATMWGGEGLVQIDMHGIDA